MDTAMIVGAIVSWAIGGILGHYSSQIWCVLTGLVLPDLPNLSGNWETTYCEVAADGTRCDVTEYVSLKRLGRYVWGKGHVVGREEESFLFNGELTRNVIVGNYKVKGAGGPSGIGAFQLKITGDDGKMVGQCMWLDKDLDEIDCSEYTWNKK